MLRCAKVDFRAQIHENLLLLLLLFSPQNVCAYSLRVKQSEREKEEDEERKWAGKTREAENKRVKQAKKKKLEVMPKPQTTDASRRKGK